MQFNLVPHPANAARQSGIQSLGYGRTCSVACCRRDHEHLVRRGCACGSVRDPSTDEPARTDELWKTTCFEAFLRPLGEENYREWNFAPSGDWAAYDFSRYRDDMAQAEIDGEPYVRMEDNLTWWAFGATIAVPADTNWSSASRAVLEEKDGTKSYWALAHPGEKPDFHDPGCFAAHLP